jgi:hypothetical protein
MSLVFLPPVIIIDGGRRIKKLKKTIGRNRENEIARSKMKETIMKIVVIGGSGLIGSQLVIKLREHGHEAIAASPSSGVNTLTGDMGGKGLRREIFVGPLPHRADPFQTFGRASTSRGAELSR